MALTPCQYHGRKRTQWENPEREHDLFTREVTSYRRLKENGLCARGVVPDFYGAIPQIRLAEWPDTLHGFKDDEVPPSAIFIEYVPNLHWIDLTNFSEAHLTKFRQVLDEFHDLCILHDDPHPRNMLIAKGEENEEDRVLWIDFDSAWTNLPDDDRRREWFEGEKLLVKQFAQELVRLKSLCPSKHFSAYIINLSKTQDHGEGKLKAAWVYHYSHG